MYVRLLGPCFKTGRIKSFRQCPRNVCAEAKSFQSASVPNAAGITDCNTRAKNPSYLPAILSSARNPHWPVHAPNTLMRKLRAKQPDLAVPAAQRHPPTSWVERHSADFIRFPSSGFTYFLTLFSKCFSSFPHGTCSLSVSCQYLALDEIYHPFRAAFPNNPTRRKRIVRISAQLKRGSHPPWRSVPRNFGRASTPKTPLLTTIHQMAIPNLSSSRFTRRYWGNPC